MGLIERDTTVFWIIADKTVQERSDQKRNIQTDLKNLKLTEQCKVFLVIGRKAAVTTRKQIFLPKCDFCQKVKQLLCEPPAKTGIGRNFSPFQKSHL